MTQEHNQSEPHHNRERLSIEDHIENAYHNGFITDEEYEKQMNELEMQCRSEFTEQEIV